MDNKSKRKIKFIMACYGLHNYGGHEYMYTKAIRDNLPKNFECQIWARKDIISEIKSELNAKPVFSKIQYNQEQSFFIKLYKLSIREYLWHKETKKELKRISSDNVDTIVFVHTFSLYSVWSWLRLLKYFNKSSIKLFLLFRYSEILLPRYLKNLYKYLCRKFPKNNPNINYFTDSNELAYEYKKSSNIELNVLPVMAKTDHDFIKKDFDNRKILNISYLGCARNDKGFFNIPSIIKRINKMSSDFEIVFNIQASLPGTDYMEKSCAEALDEINLLMKSSSSKKINLYRDQLNDSDYESLLLSSDLILLPYTGESYKVQTSGILIEAMANGIPCIVPKNTWMDKEIEKTFGGMIFDPIKHDDIATSVEKLINKYAEIYKNAQSSMNIVRQNHGPVAQTNELLRFIN